MVLGALLAGILFLIIIFVISALPLHLAVRFLGGKTTLFKTILINVLGGILVAIIQHYFTTWGGVIAFLVMVIIYREFFRLKWWKAFLVWLFELIFLAILYILFGAALLAWLGISLFI